MLLTLFIYHVHTQSREYDAAKKLIILDKGHAYEHVARMLGIVTLPNDNDVAVGMPLWVTRVRALCEHIIQMKSNTWVT